MFLDSISIIDKGGEIILSKNFKPENKDEIIKEFYFEYNKRRETVEDYYPILDIKRNYCAYIAISDLIFVTTFENDMQILLVYSLLHHVISIIKSVYESQLFADKIKDNLFSIISMIDHFFDYGYPLVNDNCALQMILKGPTVMEKMEKVMKTTGMSKTPTSNVMEKYVDSMGDIREENWSVQDIKMDNELLFDVLEYLDCVIDKDGQIIHSELHGEVKLESKSSSMVDILVYLTVPVPLKDFSVHPCLIPTFDSFEKEHILTFKAPQGTVQLLNYKVDYVQSRVPFDIIPSLKISNDEMYIEIQVRSCMIRGQVYKTDDFNTKLFLPKGITAKESKATKGVVRSNEKSMTVLWKVGDFTNMETAKLNLVYGMNGLTKEDVGNIVLAVKYQIQGYTYSGTKIDKAVFKDQDVKYGKKARCVAKSGYYEIRLN